MPPRLCRDIKLENAMLQGDAQLLKLTDFGYAKTDIESRPISKVGTPNYAAPGKVLMHMAFECPVAKDGSYSMLTATRDMR